MSISACIATSCGELGGEGSKGGGGGGGGGEGGGTDELWPALFLAFATCLHALIAPLPMDVVKEKWCSAVSFFYL